MQQTELEAAFAGFTNGSTDLLSPSSGTIESRYLNAQTQTNWPDV